MVALAFLSACVGGNALAGAAGEPETRISAVRPIARWVDLGGGARPVVVLIPTDDGYDGIAQAIADAIAKRGGVRPSVTADPSQAVPEHGHVIAVGNVNNNELIARLHWNHYAYEDALFPGPDAFSLRTVYDPYPWHGKGNVVVVGLSDVSAGTRAAAASVDRLATRDGQVGLDYTLLVSNAKPLSQKVKEALDRKQDPSFRLFHESVRNYLKTGHAAYAHHAIATLARIAGMYEQDPEHPCTFPEEMVSAEIFGAWDAFEECPLLSDDQRLRFTGVFLKFLRSLQPKVSYYDELGKDDSITWNHTTYPLLGLYAGSRYFKHYYGLAEADQHLAKAQACFLAQARSWKPQEDAPLYQACTMKRVIDYCLAEWQVDLLRRTGIVSKHADYAIGVCDNAGFNAGFGNTSKPTRPSLLRAALPRALWFTRDPRYLWVLQYVHGTRWIEQSGWFHQDLVGREPTDHLGIRVFPLCPAVYEYTRKRSYVDSVPVCPPNVPPPTAFDKISFRERWDRNAQYLLLDGFARGKHLHFDANAIIAFYDRGYRWLLDHDYLNSNTTEHCMLSVIRNSRADELIPSCAGLRCAMDVGGLTGLVSSEVKGYLGVDWQRCIFWLKGDCVAVLDRVTACEPGHYDLDLFWKVEDQGRERLASTESGPAFVVERAPQAVAPDEASGTAAARFTITWPDSLATTVTGSWPKGMKVPVRKLRQRHSRELSVGGSVEFANLLYTEAVDTPTPKHLQRIGPGAVLLCGSRRALLVMAGASVPGLTCDAEMLLVSPTTIAWANGSVLRLADGEVSSATGRCDAELRLTDGVVAGDASLRGEGLTSQVVDQWLTRLATAAPPPAHSSVQHDTAQVNWRYRFPGGGPVRRLRVAAITQDGDVGILAAAGSSVVALSTQGELQWSFDAPAACNDVAAGDVGLASGPGTVVAGEDAFVRLLDRRGRLVSQHQIRGPSWQTGFGNDPWPCQNVLVQDLDGDGRDEIVVSSMDFQVRIFDAEWCEKSRRTPGYNPAVHGSLELQALDTDGDGRLEVFVSNRYGGLRVVDSQGQMLGSYFTNIGNVQAVVADLGRDGRFEAVNGSSTGDLVCWRMSGGNWPKRRVWRNDASRLWSFDNFGYGVNRLRAVDLDGDGRLEVVVASQTGYLYVLDAAGDVKWQDRAGTDVVEVVVLERSPWRLAYFDRGGTMTLATGDGNTRRRLDLGVSPCQAVPVGDSIAVAAEDQIIRVALPE